ERREPPDEDEQGPDVRTDPRADWPPGCADHLVVVRESRAGTGQRGGRCRRRRRRRVERSIAQLISSFFPVLSSTPLALMNLTTKKATAKIIRNTSVEMADALLKAPVRISLTTNIDTVAVWDAELGDTRITGRSYMRSASRVRKRMATMSAGRTSGRVILVNCCHREAPSTRAAS